MPLNFQIKNVGTSISRSNSTLLSAAATHVARSFDDLAAFPLVNAVSIATYVLPYPLMSYQVRELILPDGTSPYAAWFTTLDPVAAAKISVATTRMEQGNLSNVEWFQGIGEYKVDWGPGYRIYLAKDGLRIIILLGGGSKKRQQKDIAEAVALWEDHKRLKAQTKKGT